MQSMIGITKLMLQASIETGFDHTRGSLDCWELCFDELCHAYAVHVRGGDVLSVSRCNGIGVHVRKDLGSQAPCELGSMRMPEPDMTWQGKTLHDVHRLRCLHGPPDGGDLANVPRGEPRSISVDDVRWSHGDVKDRFSDGFPVLELVNTLERDPGYQRREQSLWLDVVWFENNWWSIRNRRLWAFKETQKRLRI